MEENKTIEHRDEKTGEVYRISFSEMKLLENIKEVAESAISTSRRTNKILTIVIILLIVVALVGVAAYVKIDSLNIAKLCIAALQ